MTARIRRAAAVALLGITVAACGAREPSLAATPSPSRSQGSSATSPTGASTAATTRSKDVETSGAAARLTHLVYAFGSVTGGRCAAGDRWADYEKPIAAADSVDGGRRRAGDALRGNIGQLRKLKARHPRAARCCGRSAAGPARAASPAAAADPAAFAASCHALLTDPRWAGVFDGIDIDWEYPNACGLACDYSGRDALRRMLAALRSTFGPAALVTAAVPGDVGKLDATDYAGAARSADWLSAMTYDYFGTAGGGPDRAALAAHRVPRHPARPPRPPTPPSPSCSSSASRPQKILLGVGFYGRGWTGVSAAQPGGRGGRSGRRPLREGCRGLPGAGGPVPADRHGRRHRVRPLRRPVVELRHAGDHQDQDGVRPEQVAGRRVRLGAQRRHAQPNLLTAMADGLGRT